MIFFQLVQLYSTIKAVNIFQGSKKVKHLVEPNMIKLIVASCEIVEKTKIKTCIGLFQKKNPEKSPWKFQIDFTLKNSGENKLLPLEIQQNCVILPGSSKIKNQDSWNFHMSFYLNTLRNSISFSIEPWNFHIFFL